MSGRPIHRLPADSLPEFETELEAWQREGKSKRLWRRDPTLWTGADEGEWLGWLDIAAHQLAHRERFREFAEEVREERFRHALLIGMGGSSLCGEVLQRTLGSSDGFPQFHLLDTIDPAEIRSTAARCDLSSTLFIVSSKSGTTLETSILKDYFFDRARRDLGPEEAGRRFVAITDPGSKLEGIARGDQFRRVFYGPPSTGGRYSALSDFGIVPAAIMGLDLPRLLGRAAAMTNACGPDEPAVENPGVVLGTILGVLARHGRDKVTIVPSPGLRPFGTWLEQLLAESTGKQGRGLVPIEGEETGTPDQYGNDRVFVRMKLAGDGDCTQEAALNRLEKEGHPIVTLDLADRYDLGGEFFRWEFATAVAGAVLGINPFDQPDVEAGKAETRNLTTAYEASGSFPPEEPFAEDGAIRLFADRRNSRVLISAVGGKSTVREILRAHLNRIESGDYFAVLAYVERSGRNLKELQTIREAVRRAKRVATCVGIGPRFLHSTGQAHKGGPNTGVFLQVTSEDGADLPVPGRFYSFGVVKAAQARGDLAVLAERGRRALRVDVGPDAAAGITRLREIVIEVIH